MSDANDPGRAPRGTSHSRGQHEQSDANAWAVAGLAVSVLLVIAIAQPLVSEVFDWLRAGRRNPTRPGPRWQSRPNPRLRDCKSARRSISTGSVRTSIRC